MITTKTKGEAPTVPIARSFLEVSAGSVTLHLNAWKDGGCSILYFVVEYKPRYLDDVIVFSYYYCFGYSKEKFLIFPNYKRAASKRFLKPRLQNVYQMPFFKPR